jgi:hypothetical protein
VLYNVSAPVQTVRLRTSGADSLCHLLTTDNDVAQAVTHTMGLQWEFIRERDDTEDEWLATKRALSVREVGWGWWANRTRERYVTDAFLAKLDAKQRRQVEAEVVSEREERENIKAKASAQCVLLESCALRYLLNKRMPIMEAALAPFHASYADCKTVVVGIHVRMGGYALMERNPAHRGGADRNIDQRLGSNDQRATLMKARKDVIMTRNVPPMMFEWAHLVGRRLLQVSKLSVPDVNIQGI